MTLDTPALIIIHGDDEFAFRARINQLYAQLGDPSIADLNFTRLDGRQANLDDIRTASASIPFLAERRLVVLGFPFARINKNDTEAQQRFTRLLEKLPPFTTLVLCVDDEYEKKDWKVFSSSHWLRKWNERQDVKGKIEIFKLPEKKAMPGWISQRVKEKKGAISPDAAALLASCLDNDTRQADQEIEKLLTYTNNQRPINIQDVELLTANTSLGNVFDLTDALANRDGQKAMQHLCTLRDQMEPAALFSRFTYQFRYLLLAREVIDEQGGEQIIQNEIGVHPYVAKKLNQQARRFDGAELVWIYRRLLELDEQIKTGQIGAGLAMEMLITEIAK